MPENDTTQYCVQCEFVAREIIKLAEQFDRAAKGWAEANAANAALKARLAEVENSTALKWEADHQAECLKRHGLAEEFPFGCDAIDHVAEALIGSRARVAGLEATRDGLVEHLVAYKCASKHRSLHAEAVAEAHHDADCLRDENAALKARVAELEEEPDRFTVLQFNLLKAEIARLRRI